MKMGPWGYLVIVHVHNQHVWFDYGRAVRILTVLYMELTKIRPRIPSPCELEKGRREAKPGGTATTDKLGREGYFERKTQEVQARASSID